MPICPLRPNEPDVAPADLIERYMLMLDDEQWSALSSKVLADNDGPIITGDPFIDKWESELFNRIEGAMENG